MSGQYSTFPTDLSRLPSIDPARADGAVVFDPFEQEDSAEKMSSIHEGLTLMRSHPKVDELFAINNLNGMDPITFGKYLSDVSVEYLAERWKLSLVEQGVGGAEAGAIAREQEELFSLIEQLVEIASWNLRFSYRSIMVVNVSDVGLNDINQPHLDGLHTASLDSDLVRQSVIFAIAVKAGTIYYPTVSEPGVLQPSEGLDVENPSDADVVARPRILPPGTELDPMDSLQVLPGRVLVQDQTAGPWHMASPERDYSLTVRFISDISKKELESRGLKQPSVKPRLDLPKKAYQVVDSARKPRDPGQHSSL